jgi:hypothetical protein
MKKFYRSSRFWVLIGLIIIMIGGLIVMQLGGKII